MGILPRSSRTPWPHSAGQCLPSLKGLRPLQKHGLGNSMLWPDQARHGLCPSLERERVSMGFGLQQPQKSRGRIKAKAAAFSQYRDGQTTRRESSMRPDFPGKDNSYKQGECGAQPKKDCGTGRNLPALGPRLKGTTCHPLEACKRSLPGEKFPVLTPRERQTTHLAFQDFTMVHHSQHRKGF